MKKTIITTILIIVLQLGNAIATEPSRWYDAENCLLDLAGTQENLTAVNSAQCTMYNGNYVYNLSANAAKYWSGGTDGLITGAGARTLCAWHYAISKNVTSQDWIATFGGDSVAGRAFGIGLNNDGNPTYNGYFAFGFDTADSWFNEPLSFAQQINSWHHACVVYNGTGWKNYFDGASVSNKSTTLNTLAGATFYIGRRSTTNAAYGSGYVDDVRYYNVSLTSEEIYNLSTIYPDKCIGLCLKNSRLILGNFKIMLV